MKRAVLPLIVACCLAFVGCSGPLFATRSSHVAYDHAKDEFAHLQVFHDIYVDRDENSQKLSSSAMKERQDATISYLADLWDNRFDLVFLPGWGPLETSQAVLVVSPKTYRELSLQSRRDRPPLENSPIDLTQITTQPGEFFPSKDGTLCYYHVCRFPGAVVDKWLEQMTLKLNDSTLDNLIEHRTERRSKEFKRGSWSELNKPLSYDLLEEESIRMLIQQTSARTIALKRDKERLLLGFRLTPADAAGLDLWRDKQHAEWERQVADTSTKASARNEAREALELSRSLDFATKEDGAVTITFNIVSLLPSRPPTFAPSEEVASASAEDLVALAARNVPINKTLTLEKVFADFNKPRP